MSLINKVLLTGSSGFVGSELLEQLSTRAAQSIVIASRSELPALEGRYPVFALGDFGPHTSWCDALVGVDCVIHTAGRAHILQKEANALQLFREANTQATLNLATQAAAAGVKRFVFISSIGVNGAFTTDKPFCERSVPAPHADYATSKLEAEIALLQLAESTDMEVVIIRPPLVYAAHAPGNFRRLLKLVDTGLPLPFGRVKNSRSMVALENLVDLIIVCIDHPAAANQLFLASDGEDVSTAQMIKYLAKGMGRKTILLPIPITLLRVLAKLAGKQGLYTQLCGSLQIDSAKASQLLGWRPPVSPEKAMVAVGKKFIDGHVGS